MVWAGFSAARKLRLAFTSNLMNSGEYQRVLQDCLLPFLRLPNGNNFTFMQDNVPIHRSRSTRYWLTAQNINVLPWPDYSPDLNPIENLRGILVRRIYAENRQFQTRKELQEAILEAWQEIEQRTIDNLFRSMPNRLFQLIQCNEGPIDY
uniref:Tc1-like transposase DDE domain-containing protein n=1 Tax=Acrobeloides nanus TaxID=290746 RepID=A0A914D0K0_9BILA